MLDQLQPSRDDLGDLSPISMQLQQAKTLAALLQLQPTLFGLTSFDQQQQQQQQEEGSHDAAPLRPYLTNLLRLFGETSYQIRRDVSQIVLQPLLTKQVGDATSFLALLQPRMMLTIGRHEQYKVKPQPQVVQLGIFWETSVLQLVDFATACEDLETGVLIKLCAHCATACNPNYAAAAATANAATMHPKRCPASLEKDYVLQLLAAAVDVMAVARGYSSSSSASNSSSSGSTCEGVGGGRNGYLRYMSGALMWQWEGFDLNVDHLLLLQPVLGPDAPSCREGIGLDTFVFIFLCTSKVVILNCMAYGTFCYGKSGIVSSSNMS